jgi:hypothetical protein
VIGDVDVDLFAGLERAPHAQGHSAVHGAAVVVESEPLGELAIGVGLSRLQRYGREVPCLRARHVHTSVVELGGV